MTKRITWSALTGVMAWLAIGCSIEDATETTCTVTKQGDTTTLACADGTQATIDDGKDGVDGTNGADGVNGVDGTNGVDGSNGVDGQDGLSCTVTDNGDGTKTISCEDGTTATVSDGADGAAGVDGADGADGADGSSCTVTDNGDGTKTISCEDGTSATVSDGVAGQDGADGSSCSVTDHGDGSKTIACTDGSSVVVRDGQDGANGADGSSCTVTTNTDGSKTMTCEDGTSVTWMGAPESCLITFEDAYAAGQYNLNTYYGASGIQFNGGMLIGGDANGDPGNWDVPNAAWGLHSGTQSLVFTHSTNQLKFDFLRTFWDNTLTVVGYLNGAEVARRTVTLTGGYDAEPVDFVDVEVDRVEWVNPGVAYAIDNLHYSSLTGCR